MRYLMTFICALCIVRSASTFVSGTPIPAEPQALVLPIVVAHAKDLTQLAICVVNRSDEALELAIDDSGIRNVEVEVFGDGKRLMDVEAQRTDPARVPRVSLDGNMMKVVSLNLGNFAAIENLPPGRYHVRIRLTQLDEERAVTRLKTPLAEFLLELRLGMNETRYRAARFARFRLEPKITST